MGEEIFLVLDVGAEAVKALIYKRKDSKIVVLGSACQYFEQFGVFDGWVSGMDVIKKAILKAIEKVYNDFVIFSEKEKVPGDGWRSWPLLLSLAPTILKARVDEQSFRRQKPEKKISRKEQELIYQQVLRKAQQEISQRFAKDSGILASEIQWINSKILARKIDGYLIPKLQGYQGKNLEFKILATFLPKYYFRTIERIFADLKLKISKIVHLAEVIPNAFEQKDAVFLDVGGEVSQIFSVRGSFLRQIKEFRGGGKMFSQRLSEALGINEESARILKERYAEGLLSQESRQRIKEMFWEEKRRWSEDLELRGKGWSSLNIFLFGGASLLPEIQESLPGAKIVYPKDLKNIKDATKNLNNPQYIPALLISYAKEVF